MVKHIGEILRKFGEIQPKISKSLYDERAIKLWQKAIDGRIAKQTEASIVKNKVLYVLTSTSTWAHELTLLRKKILERINSFAGREILKDIRFRVGRIEKKAEGQTGKPRKKGRKCRSCGATHNWEEETCPVCRVYASNNRKKIIYQAFGKTLSVDFTEIQRRIPDLSREEFAKAKSKARALILDRIRLIGREAERNPAPQLIVKLKTASVQYVQAYVAAFGGEENALLKKNLGAKGYKALRIRSKAK